MNYLEQLEQVKAIQDGNLADLIGKIDKDIKKFTPPVLGQAIVLTYKAVNRKEKKIEKQVIHADIQLNTITTENQKKSTTQLKKHQKSAIENLLKGNQGAILDEQEEYSKGSNNNPLLQREKNSSNKGIDDLFNRDDNSKGAGSNVGSTDAINRLGMDMNQEFGFDIDGPDFNNFGDFTKGAGSDKFNAFTDDHQLSNLNIKDLKEQLKVTGVNTRQSKLKTAQQNENITNLSDTASLRMLRNMYSEREKYKLTFQANSTITPNAIKSLSGFQIAHNKAFEWIELVQATQNLPEALFDGNQSDGQKPEIENLNQFDGGFNDDFGIGGFDYGAEPALDQEEQHKLEIEAKNIELIKENVLQEINDVFSAKSRKQVNNFKKLVEKLGNDKNKAMVFYNLMMVSCSKVTLKQAFGKSSGEGVDNSLPQIDFVLTN